MHGEQDQDEVRWLGGEAQVYPRVGERKPTWQNRLMAGSLCVLAGIGIGRLGSTGGARREQQGQQGQQPDRTVDAGIRREGRGNMEQGREEEKSSGDGRVDDLAVVTILAALGLGLVVGVAAALVAAPESGTAVRSRLKRGMDTAKKEFDETVGEMKEDWSAVGSEICDSVKRTASRVKQAAEVTKDALTADSETGESDETVRRMP